MLRISVIAAFVLLSSVQTARADCTNPVAPARFEFYNADESILQYCDGANWIAYPKASANLALWPSSDSGPLLKNPQPDADDNFGWSVALAGRTALIPAEFDDPGGVSNAGSAYLYDIPTGTLLATISNPAPAAVDRFGGDVALDGYIAVVSAADDDPGGVSSAGAVFLFDATDGSLLLTINNPAPQADDWFGRSVALSGNVLVVGALGDNAGATNAGRAYVFDASDGSLMATLSNPAAATDDWFGNSVSVSENLAVIGAYADAPGGVSDAGSAYIFDATTGGVVATLSNPAPTADDWFGNSVAISGNLVVVSAPRDDPGGVSDAGIAYVFNATTGALLATLDNPAPVTGDKFGTSVAISGTVAVVGTWTDDPGGITNAGSAYVFDATDGTLLATLNNPDPTTDDNFGSDVAISGTTIIVGSYRDDPDGVSNAGQPHVFFANCVNPSGRAGQVFFNADDRVLQWCDGSTWHAAGPLDPGGPNAGCGNPAATAGKIVFNVDYSVLQYCDGDVWRAIGKQITAPACNPADPWTARDSARDWTGIASSTDGSKLVAGVSGGQLYTSTDSGVSWTARESARAWQQGSIASSSDGSKLAAGDWGGQIYTSTDSGVSWTARESARDWAAIASSSDGSKLAATVYGGRIYTSTDSGVSWTARESSRAWTGIASSADGSKLVAGVWGGQIYTSTDSGVSWTARESARNWYGIASSSDGAKLVAGVSGGQIYTSTNSGVSWTARESSRSWEGIASSSDGSKLAAVVWGGQIYASTDSGVSWTARESARNWTGVASSSNGSRLAATATDGQIYTAPPCQ